MSLLNYSKYKISIDPSSKKLQGLRPGDVVRRQYVDSPNLIYTLMVVLSTGNDTIIDDKGNNVDSPYFIGALLDGDTPKNGEVLDFVRMTSLFDENRSGALYLTASDSGAPFMDIIDKMATENSLCFPRTSGGNPDTPEIARYACAGSQYVTEIYRKSELDVYRLFKIIRNNTANPTNNTIGFKQTIKNGLKNPQTVLISYKVRASKEMNGIPISFGYVDGSKIDGESTISITMNWEYKLHVITVDHPSQYDRSFLVDLTGDLTNGDWCEIADFNMLLLSDAGNFTKASKTRIGKLEEVVDPIFGKLSGYGAYMQRLYASQDVAIAGTLTAGDENGFGNTFYAGKIAKNKVTNSEFQNNKTQTIDGVNSGEYGGGRIQVTRFDDGGPSPNMGYLRFTSIPEHPPGTSGGFRAQIFNRNNLSIKANKTYCLSFYAKDAASTARTSLNVIDNVLGYAFWGGDFEEGTLHLSPDWRRYYGIFRSPENLTINYSAYLYQSLEEWEKLDFCITGLQIEEGEHPSPYQKTDGTLSSSNDYGAWFNRGGVGGTIQNPLLNFGEDGSIYSRTRSLVLNNDGSAIFRGTVEIGPGSNVPTKEEMDQSIQESLSYDVQLWSEQGNTFVNGVIQTTITATVLLGNEDVTDTLLPTQYFWKRKSMNSDGDIVWNRLHEAHGNTLTITKADVTRSAIFICEVNIEGQTYSSDSR